MTTPMAGHTIQPYDAPELLSPGTVPRPPHIREQDWARMPWPAKWRAARAAAALRRIQFGGAR